MSKCVCLLLLGTMLANAQGFADTQTAAEEKLYVKRKNVRFIDKQIVVCTKDGAFLAPTLSSDDNGLYVKTSELQKTDLKKKGKWKKRRCKEKKRGVPSHVVKKLSQNPNVPQDVVDRLSKPSEEG